MVRNRAGRVVIWLKGKDSGDAPSFALCLFKPELADSPEMRRQLEAAFKEIKAMARELGLPLFDAAELEAQMRLYLGKNPQAPVGQEFPVFLTDLATGRRGRLTMKVHPPEAA